MTQEEKENRISSFALEFLERQQIVPNLYANQIIRGYKEGYLQAEQDLEVKEEDLDEEIDENYRKDTSTLKTKKQYAEIAKHFFELGLKAARKGE